MSRPHQPQGSPPWAIRLARENAHALAPLRRVPGVEVCEQGPVIWVRGTEGQELPPSLLRGLPADGRYTWLGGSRVLSLDRRIPSSELPGDGWCSLAEWIHPGLPPCVETAATRPSPLSLRLERSSNEQPATLLLTPFLEWERFAAGAAEVRLAPLSFAANSSGHALVRGTPLPPLPGRRWVERQGIAVPEGFTWAPAVGISVLRSLLGAAPGMLVLWLEEGDHWRVLEEQFIAATRWAIRCTGRRLSMAP
ncbi:MAG TPA: hypothetical protein DCM86_02800 [Verrucomicrobiales bacterium]|nr:hypothetical protein [Verrucomicrobiales bacterium]